MIEIASDRLTATARFHCIVQAEAAITPACPLVEMARQQGGGVIKWTEACVFENVYAREREAWKIRTLVSPDGLRNHLEGGALQGMSRALTEEVTWDDQKVTSVDWRTYRPLYLGADVPTIETVLLNRSDVRATGAGETAVTVVAAAIGNAIFDATGARVRQVPFTPERVKAALDART